MDLVVGRKLFSYTSGVILEVLRFKLTSENHASSLLVEPAERFEVSSDPDDNKFFDVVYSLKAGFLISLDKKHVLKLRDGERRFVLNGHEFLILTPAEFLEFVERDKNFKA